MLERHGRVSSHVFAPTVSRDHARGRCRFSTQFYSTLLEQPGVRVSHAESHDVRQHPGEFEAGVFERLLDSLDVAGDLAAHLPPCVCHTAKDYPFRYV